MNYLKASIGGIIGGLIGAAIWAGIAYGTGYEVGYIASAIGAAVGFGVRLGAGEEDGAGYGVLAVVIAIAAVLVGKLGATELIIQREFARVAAEKTSITDSDMITQVARGIELQQMIAKNTMSPQLAEALLSTKTLSQFAPDIVQRATATWNANPAELREQLKAEAYTEYKQNLAGALPKVRQQLFAQSFGVFDVLWFILATLAAFRLGSGASSDD